MAWGRNDQGQCNVPAGNNYVAAAAGEGHSVALRSDGSLVAWGDNWAGQCDVPAGNNYVAVASGYNHSMAIVVGVPPVAVTRITPSAGLNTGAIGVNPAGIGFKSGATARLARSGESDIFATDVTVVSSTQITCSLDLTGRTPGAWNVVVTNPDDQSGTLADGFTITAPSVSGTVTLEKWSPPGAVSLPATIKYRLAGGTALSLDTVLSVTSSEDKGTATYEIPGLTPGVYDVLVKPSHWLAKKIIGVDVSSGSVGNADATCQNGDINGDNVVNFSDYLVLQTNYKKNPPPNPSADMNGDGAANFSDYLILQASYKEAGDAL